MQDPSVSWFDLENLKRWCNLCKISIQGTQFALVSLIQSELGVLNDESLVLENKLMNVTKKNASSLRNLTVTRSTCLVQPILKFSDKFLFSISQ